jgi:hypothetical protein
MVYIIFHVTLEHAEDGCLLICGNGFANLPIAMESNGTLKSVGCGGLHYWHFDLV